MGEMQKLEKKVVIDTDHWEGLEAKNYWNGDGECYTIENIKFCRSVVILTSKLKIEFKNCTFSSLSIPDENKNITFTNCFFNELNTNINLNGGFIEHLTLKDKTFTDNFYLNRDGDELTIKRLTIAHCTFKKKFRLHNAKICTTQINNCDFQADVEFSACEFVESQNDTTRFYRIMFEKMVFFDRSRFFKFALFDRVTFGDDTSFKRCRFDNGLDLERTTIKKTLNFAGVKGLETKASLMRSPKETYRIIKYHFDKLKNRIEANKFQALELEAEYRDMKQSWSWKLLPKFLVYSVHKYTSNFTTSWLLPLVLIFMTGGIYALKYCCDIWGFDGINYYCITSSMFQWDKYIDETCRFASIFYNGIGEKAFFEQHPFAMVSHKAILGFLYYQFIMAIRRDTRR